MTPIPLRFRSVPATREKPLCTRFFPLAPQGLGTGLQESLPSYLDRLARLHAVRNGPFVWHEIHPCNSSPGALLGTHSCEMLLAGSRVAQQVASFVAISTGASEVAGLVQPALARCLYLYHNNIRPKAAWCPLCFSDWSRARMPIYRPLLWALTSVRCCPIHHILLQDRCPGCLCQFDHYGTNGWPSSCPNCARPLSQHDSFSDADQHQHASSHDEFCSTHLFYLLAWGAACDQSAIPLSCFQRNICNAMQAQGSRARLCRLTDFKRNTIDHWLTGLVRPRLPALLRLSYCFDVPLYHWFARLIPEETFGNGREAPKGLSCFGYSAVAPLTILEKGINASLAQMEVNPPSLSEIAKTMRVKATTLARRCPNLARQIVERYAQARVHRKEQLARRKVLMVRDAITEIRASGRNISCRAMICILQARGLRDWDLHYIIRRETQRSEPDNLGTAARSA